MASLAKQSVVNKLSARPWASLARVFALAGAMMMASAQRASSMCFMPADELDDSSVDLESSLLSKKTG